MVQTFSCGEVPREDSFLSHQKLVLGLSLRAGAEDFQQLQYYTSEPWQLL